MSGRQDGDRKYLFATHAHLSQGTPAKVAGFGYITTLTSSRPQRSSPKVLSNLMF